MNRKIELYAFYSNTQLTEECDQSGISGMVIDWENSSKRTRQSLYNTQINLHTEKELIEVRRLTSKPVICRVNGGSFLNKTEISKAIDHGANYIMVPMIKSLKDVEAALRMIDQKAKSILMIETEESLGLVDSLKNYQIDKVYVGLNDLAISRNCNNIFLPFIDGTIKKIRESITTEFGIAGLTHPHSGNPIGSHLLIQELKRLNCNFTFLRRSFYNDLKNYSLPEIITEINRSFDDEGPDNQSEELRMIIKNITQPLI